MWLPDLQAPTSFVDVGVVDDGNGNENKCKGRKMESGGKLNNNGKYSL